MNPKPNDTSSWGLCCPTWILFCTPRFWALGLAIPSYGFTETPAYPPKKIKRLSAHLRLAQCDSSHDPRFPPQSRGLRSLPLLCRHQTSSFGSCSLDLC